MVCHNILCFGLWGIEVSVIEESLATIFENSQAGSILSKYFIHLITARLGCRT